MKEGSALLIVDVQKDFCPGGSLGIRGGNEIICTINRYIDLFRRNSRPILFSRDWHPPDSTHFKAFGGLWPVHCVRGTEGAMFHPDLKLDDDAIILSKGMDPEVDDSYSASRATTESGASLSEVLREKGVQSIYICGLATDYCVRATALDSLSDGFEVTVLADAVRGVDLEPGDSEKAIAEIVAAGAEVATLNDLEKRST